MNRSARIILVYRILLALVFSTAVDVSLSAANGYTLRTDSALLALLDGVFLSIVVAPCFLSLHALRRFPQVCKLSDKAPWLFTALAGWTPIEIVWLWRSHSPVDLLIHLAIISSLIVVAYVQIRRERRAKWRGFGLAAGAIATVPIMLAVLLPVPGRAMLHGPNLHAKTSSSPDKPNLLMIVIDTVRADHLKTYGYSRDTMPWLDSFAKKSTVFEHAIAAASYTLPSHATLFTGLFPESHGADISKFGGGTSLKSLGMQPDYAPVEPLSPDARTLAEIARESGMETGAICANSAYLYHGFGLNQGFSTYVDRRGVIDKWRPAGLSIGNRLLTPILWRFNRLLSGNEKHYLYSWEVNELAERWLEQRQDRRFFLFLNYMDAHVPYIPVGKYRKMYPHTFDRQIVDAKAIEKDHRHITAEERDPMIDAYDADLRCMDDHLKELFEDLEKLKLLDNTIIVLAADHGESFGEHDLVEHHNSVYESEVHVPLIYHTPGQTEGKREERTVHLVDVMPTLLDQAGIPRPPVLQGDSLFKAERVLPVVAYLGKYERDFEEHAIYDGPWKMIARSDGPVSLYNLKNDPEELTNVASQNPEIMEKMRKQLEDFESKVQPMYSEPPPIEDVEGLRRLRGLGYIK